MCCHVFGAVQMSSEASRLAVSIGGVEERVSSEAKLVQAERAHLDKQKRRLTLLKVRRETFIRVYSRFLVLRDNVQYGGGCFVPTPTSNAERPTCDEKAKMV